jgi:hypothetical protein
VTALEKADGTVQRSVPFFLLTRFIDGLQLRRAISFQAEGKKLLEKHLSRRQLQGFVSWRRAGKRSGYD